MSLYTILNILLWLLKPYLIKLSNLSLFDLIFTKKYLIFIWFDKKSSLLIWLIFDLRENVCCPIWQVFDLRENLGFLIWLVFDLSLKIYFCIWALFDSSNFFALHYLIPIWFEWNLAITYLITIWFEIISSLLIW